MAGKTPAEAVNNYLEPLLRAVSSVTKGALYVSNGGYRAELNPHLLVLGSGRQALAGGLTLTFEQGYEIVEAEGERGPWKCSTTRYQYALDDADDHEIVAYHWHPAGESDVTRPHVHLGIGAKIKHLGLLRAHLPTNRIAAEDFLLLAIRDLALSRCAMIGAKSWKKPGIVSNSGRRGPVRIGPSSSAGGGANPAAVEAARRFRQGQRRPRHPSPVGVWQICQQLVSEPSRTRPYKPASGDSCHSLIPCNADLPAMRKYRASMAGEEPTVRS